MASGAVNTFRQIGYALGIAAFGSVFADRIAHTTAGSGLFRYPAAAAAQASQGGAQALIATSARPAAVSHVVHAAYASGQNSIYLAAGVAALIGGVLVLALIRPGPPAEPDQAGANAPAVSVRSPS
jgi:hypothetical protein